MTFLLGFACASAFWIGFIWFAIWHSRRYPLVRPEQHEHVSADHCETHIYCPPSYGLRVVPK